MAESCQIFTASEIDSVRRAGKILHECLEHTAKEVRAGITTIELDRIAEAFIRSHGGVPAFKGYNNFPATLCTSVNEEIVHAIPRDRALQEGDIISLDCGVIIDGLYTDACVTVGVGNISDAARHLIDVTKDTLDAVLKEVVKAGVKVGTISSFIQKHLEAEGLKPVKALTGHGLGRTLHQFPEIPNFGRANTGPALPEGTIIAIEPIASVGSDRISSDDDGWTIRTQDNALSSHSEHTVLITKNGCEVLT